MEGDTRGNTWYELNDDSDGTIVVKDFASGKLGINAPGASTPTAPPVPSATYDLGTTAGRDAWNSDYDDVTTQNIVLQNAAAPQNDGTAANPLWVSHGSGTRGGNDVIEGGAIAALNTVTLAAGDGDDRVYAGVTATLQDAIARGDATEGIAVPDTSRYLLDGGQGKDQIIGSDAHDVIFGGEGDDTIVGGQGGDVIIADGEPGGLMTGPLVGMAAEMIMPGNSTQDGMVSALNVIHWGPVLGYGLQSPTGGRVFYVADPLALSINPLAQIDFSALLDMDDVDVRGKGYVAAGYALVEGQPVGANAEYTGPGALQTNAQTGNETIWDEAINRRIVSKCSNKVVQYALKRYCDAAFMDSVEQKDFKSRPASNANFWKVTA